MADWRNYYKKGLVRAEYRRDKAQLEKFDALESDWKELFQWVMSAAWEKKYYDPTRKTTERLIHMWHNHVMTVLIEIVCKNTDEYKDTFVKSRGTMDQKLYTRNLREKIHDWTHRLDTFLRTRSLEGSVVHQDSSIRAAQSIRQHLADAVQGKVGDKFQPGRSLNPTHQPFYQMLQAIKNIKQQSEDYIRMIEDSGKIDPSLALLLVYIRNYCHVAGKFNDTLLSLPRTYHDDILRVRQRPIEPDYTYLVVQPKDEGFTLYENTPFLAGNIGGQDVYYHTQSPQYLTGGKLTRACTVFLRQHPSEKNRLYTQEIDFANPSDCTVLFDPSRPTDAPCGWMLESHMFLLEEGKRHVTVSFRLTAPSVSLLAQHRPTEADLSGAFTLRASYAEGWMNYLPSVTLTEADGSTHLTFQFTIIEAEYPLSPCQEEIHHTATTYPCLQILARNENCPYDWAHHLSFDRIGIDVHVEGIRHFNLYNELGEIDSAQAFYPFGTQAERGTWFMFSHNETNKKTLRELSLKGTWNKLPSTTDGYTGIYRNYTQEPPLTNESFIIKTEYQQNEKWYPCPDTLLPLFSTHEEGTPSETATIPFRMTDDHGLPIAEQPYLPNTAYQRGTNLLFRVTLHAPAIGFGMDEYRRLFAEVMIYNSSRKEKEQKEIPASPTVPLLSDVELSYKASWNSDDPAANPARLQRIADYNEYEECPLPPTSASYPFVEDLRNEHNLYLQFTGLRTDRKLSMYVDLSYICQDMFLSDGSFTSEAPYLELDYRKDGQWFPLKPEYLLLEATCGLTQNGFIELSIPQELRNTPYLWLRARLQGHTGQYPAIRHLFLNCLKVVANGGDGAPLPAETIQKMQIEDPRVASILQPLPGFGGRPAEAVADVSIRQSARIAHRNRAVTPKDYERMVLEQFPDLLKVHCLSNMCTEERDVYVVVFSYTEGNPYPTTPAWRLAEIRNWLSTRISPFVSLKVCNPCYRKVDIVCKAILQDDAEDEGEIRRRMTTQIREYFALWLLTGQLPELGKTYSYKELHTRLANDPDILQLVALTINGVQPDVQATNIHATDQSIPDGPSPIGTVWIPYNIRIDLLPYKDTEEKLAD